jgi:hypothetical protein
MVPLRCLVAGLCLAAAAPAASPASQLIDRNAKHVQLAVSEDGVARVTYRVGGVLHHARASSAINALPPSATRPQVAFALDRSVDLSRGRSEAAREFRNSCRPYDGPPLRWLVAACKASDGSYWALQSWQKRLPNYGAKPTKAQAAAELHLSHWRGALPTFYVNVDWAYAGRFDNLYGSLAYGGSPVYGFKANRFGAPLDSYGRNVYVDTYNSAYGPGWRRENSFLTQRPSGAFCYAFFARAGVSGKGEMYRATVMGPGVLPDLFWEGRAPGAYDAAADRARNDEMRRLGARPDCLH